MYIITQQQGNVNPLDKWEEKKTASEKMAMKMREAGYEARALRMLACNDTLSFIRCKECGKMHINRATLCRDRFCPACQWRLSKQRYAAMYDILKCASDEYPNAVYTFCTLTVQNVRVGDLDRCIRKMSADWTKILQRDCAKAARGWARCCEITYNKGAHTVHPHYHVIWMWDSYEAADLYADEIIHAWTRYDPERRCIAGQHSEFVYKRDIDQETVPIKAALEATKYMCKATDMLDMPTGEFYALVEQIAGKRMTAFGGTLKEFKRIVNVDLETVMQERHNGICTQCGSDKTHEILVKWSGGHYQEIAEGHFVVSQE